MKRFISPDDPKIKYPSLVFLKDIFGFLRPYKWKFFAASVLRLVGDIAWLYPVYGLATIINYLTDYTLGQSLRPVWVAFGLWTAAVVIRQFTQFSYRMIAYTAVERLALDTTYKGIGHLFLLDMAWHEKENSGNKLKRIQNGSQGLDRIFRVWFNSLIAIGVSFIGTIFIISRFDGVIAWLMITFLVTYFSLSFFLTRKAARASYLVSVEEEKVSGLLFEAVGNIRTVKAMAMARSLNVRLQDAMNMLFDKVKARVFRFQSRYFMLNVWGWTFRLGILAFIIVGISRGRYELGFLVLFNGYFMDIWKSVSELSDASQDITVAKYNIARMKETLNESVRIDSEEGKVAFPRSWRTISLRNLSFSYGDNEVLSDISFDIDRGQKIGIVGLSGAGKSTLFKLLLKEYESSEGEVFFDDIPLRSISKTDYFKYVSVVMQETEVFNFPLKENITMVSPEKEGDSALLNHVLKIAHVADFVRKLPQGLDTLIGERGVKLSGGEKQRLGIARAVFKEPQLLLLDEATSHLDLESEGKIQESLHEFFEQVTAVVIAHRLTTIKAMDTIIVFEDGKMAEMGNFDELYAKQGRFHELWEKQKL